MLLFTLFLRLVAWGWHGANSAKILRRLVLFGFNWCPIKSSVSCVERLQSGNFDMYMSYRWVSFWWKVTWQRHTESETRPSEIISSITKTMLRHNEITHNAHLATRISLYYNSHPVTQQLEWGGPYLWYDVLRSVDLLFHIPKLHVTSYHVYDIL